MPVINRKLTPFLASVSTSPSNRQIIQLHDYLSCEKQQNETTDRPVRELQQENYGSLRKLQGTAEQFEWLCQQQRYWMCCVKRFKDGLMEERDALLGQVITLKKKAEKLKKSLHEDGPTQSVLCPLQDTKHRDSSRTSWDADEVADLESQVEKSNMLYAELFNQLLSERCGGPQVSCGAFDHEGHRWQRGSLPSDCQALKRVRPQ
ncbi:uncharacterized protein LOC129089779 [Anoplopoma fimbria]|uniref:uncharacterized protein LOC129089779 n=1 Tax=Anoplopoma fimbria TaxID=229290 RepID=UPI0023EA824F|nr:uncharacterized protein LOC129089779 [Anoplopoma fimbria]